MNCGWHGRTAFRRSGKMELDDADQFDDRDIRWAMPERFHRRSIRLRGYDYAQAGAYFVTICTHERAHLFGRVAEGMMMPNTLGDIVQWCWNAIPNHMPMVMLDEFIAMPNHVHGIIMITDGPGPVVMERGSVAGAGSVGAGNFPPLPMPVAPATVDGTPSDPATNRPMMQKGSLGHIVQTFKAGVSRQAVKGGLIERGIPIWQRGYYEHIIRDTAEHDRIAQYIAENPAHWALDEMNR